MIYNSLYNNKKKTRKKKVCVFKQGVYTHALEQKLEQKSKVVHAHTSTIDFITVDFKIIIIIIIEFN